jgi:hypothetical protein
LPGGLRRGDTDVMQSTPPNVGYRCTQCGRKLTRRECVLIDDAMAPFGPEMTCPDCGALALPWTSTWAVFLAGVLGFLAAMASR